VIRILKYLIPIFFFITADQLCATSANRYTIYFINEDLVSLDSITITLDEQILSKKPNPIYRLIRQHKKKNKKIVAALLAFPFPFGIVGLHRIYLGTAPYVPVAYIASLGGVFGILPFIDFCVLLMDKDLERYNNNKQVFMWIR
jgi:TM2 domain-containing membrane protein YozV